MILTLAVLVIGPERVPGFAADLAKWIRKARAYANHMMKDFNEVVTEVQKEAGASADDWKEIASVFNRHTGDVAKEITRAGATASAAMPTESMLNGTTSGAPTVTPPAISTSGSNGSNGSYNGSNGASTPAPPAVQGYGSTPPYPYETRSANDSESMPLGESMPGEAAPCEELAWYVPERRHRRRPVDIG
jgi:Sec-independent protein translocase protein TatA